MVENTRISWADDTFNPWEGCQKTGSMACEHCYAETQNARFGGGVAPNWGPHAPRRRTSPANWAKPLKWNREQAEKWHAYLETKGVMERAIAAGRSGIIPMPPAARFVFCASLADVFDNQVPHEWRHDLFTLIRATPHLTWLLLTKRPQMIINLFEEAARIHPTGVRQTSSLPPLPQIWPRNAAIGCTVVTQEEADRDIPKLLAAKQALKPAFAFISVEPMLGPLEIGHFMDKDPTHGRFGCVADPETGIAPYIMPPSIDWCIVGGESGAQARPMHPDWVRDLRDQCAAAGVPFHFKQWGEWAPSSAEEWEADDGHFRHMLVALDGRSGDSVADLITAPPGTAWMRRLGKKTAGRTLDGVTHDARPTI